MLSNRHARNLLGLLLGGCAGLSLTVSILPMVLQMGAAGDQWTLTRLLAPLWPWVTLIWAVGGWSVARMAAPLTGLLILAVVGAVTGGMAVGFGVGLNVGPIAIGTGAGAVYGSLGGLILGRVLSQPSSGETDA